MSRAPKAPAPPGRPGALAQLREALPLVAAGLGLYIVDRLLGTGAALVVLAAGAAVYIYHRRIPARDGRPAAPQTERTSAGAADTIRSPGPTP